jgi:hypothetical protein
MQTDELPAVCSNGLLDSGGGAKNLAAKPPRICLENASRKKFDPHKQRICGRLSAKNGQSQKCDLV